MNWVVLGVIVTVIILVGSLLYMGVLLETNIPVQIYLYFGAIGILIHGVNLAVRGIRKHYIYRSTINPKLSFDASKTNRIEGVKDFFGGLACIIISVVAFFSIYNL